MDNNPMLVTEGRCLVTIRKIDNLFPIDGADFIQLAEVDSWTVIVKKGEFQKEDYCVFFEIDSFLPASDSRFEFMKRSGVKTTPQGEQRIRVRSMKMRKQLSQGLALPLHLFPEINPDDVESLEDSRYGVEQFINVTKYESQSERNSNAGAACKTAGNFPVMIPKTDEPRIQNVYKKHNEHYKGVSFARSLKVDGSSTTVAYFNNPDYFTQKLDDIEKIYDEETQEMVDGEVTPYPFNYPDSQVVVCSRNLTLKHDENNHFWKAIANGDVIAKLKDYCYTTSRQLAVQGETAGPGIQGNREQLEQHEFYAFRVWDIDNRCFLNYNDFMDFCKSTGIQMIPQLGVVKFFDHYNTITEILASADHESITHPVCEGDVYVSTVPIDGVTVHFKVINNKFLLKCEE